MKYFILLFLLLGACSKEKGSPGRAAYDHSDLISYEDKSRGVVCYRVIGWHGFSCVKVGRIK
jgi:hypothetical protein